MRFALLFLILSGLAAASAPLVTTSRNTQAPEPDNILAELAAQPGCGPAPALVAVSGRVLRLDGMGNAVMPGASSKLDAQSWFENGLTLAHAFQHQEAITVFQEAQRLDPSCALCVWGEAWGLGPTINYQVGPDKRAAAKALLQRAAALATDAPAAVQALIAATLKRSQTGDAKLQDVAFAQSMDALAHKNSGDVELAVLAADAWLIANFTWGDQRGYPRALSLLERALKQKPNDVGAIHFYIHAAEMANQPAKALAVSQLLPRLAPRASHLIHMPAHTYYRVGQYEKAVLANRDAARAGADYAKVTGLQGALGGLAYYGHSLHYGMAAALMSGDAKAGLFFADGFAKAYPDFSDLAPWSQLEATKYYVVKGRFASRADVLSLQQPSPPLLRAMWRYARGEALARDGDAADVRKEASKMQISADELKAFGGMAGLAEGILDVARFTLEGRAAMLDKNWPGAIAAFGKAAKADEQTLSSFRDPAWWWGSPRRSIAAAYIKSGKPLLAKQQAEQALQAWPNDPAALLALSVAQSVLGDAKRSSETLKAARAGWVGDPTMLRLDRI